MNVTVYRDWINFLAELYICYILTHEFFYDKRVYESKRSKIKRTKNKVRIAIEDGQAVILEKPDNVEVVTEHKSEN